MKILFYIALYLMATDALLGLSLLFTKRLGDYMYPIVFTALISFLEDYIGNYLGFIYRNNIWFYFIINPIEYAGFAWFFIININNLIVKRTIKASIWLLLLPSLGYAYFLFQLPVLTATILIDYQIVIKGALLVMWSVIYIIDIFNQINNFKKLNVFVLMVVGAILFYFSFEIIYQLSEIYLFNYSDKHNVPIKEMFSPKNAGRMYASRQYAAMKPLLFLTNILLYLCIFVAIMKSSIKAKKAYKVSV